MKPFRLNQIAAVIIIAATIMLAAALASQHPDGLERVAERLGFVSRASEEPTLASPLPDYTIAAITSPFWSTTTAGFVGATTALFVTLLLGRLLRKKQR